MKNFLLEFYNQKIIIVIYLIILTIFAVYKFRKNTKEKTVFSCENLFIMLFYVFIAIAPIYAVWVNNYTYTYNIFFLFFLLLVFFVLGADFLIGNKTLKTNRLTRFFKIKNVEYKYVNRNATMFLIIGYICLAIFLIKNLQFIMQDFENNRVLAMQGSGVIIHLGYIILPATWILYYCHLNYKKSKLIYLFIILDIVVLFLMGFRARILELILLLIIIRNDYKPFPIKKLILCGLVLIIAVIGLQSIRTVLSGGSADKGIEALINTMGVSSVNLNYIFDSFPKKVPFQYGYTYLLGIGMLLPGPNIDATLWLKEVLNMNYAGGGLTPSIIGEFFINFGFIGIFIGMLLLGMVCRLIDNAERKGKIPKCMYYVIMLYMARSVGSGISTFAILAVWFLIITYIILKIKIKGNKDE